MVPNKNNFCGGAFDDWREVLLISKCNGKCTWCVERGGFHPTEEATVERLIELLEVDDATKIILLGGEPMLYESMRELIRGLPGKQIYITTNGTNITEGTIRTDLSGLKGLNISIHHYDLKRNRDITGILLQQEVIENAVVECRRQGTEVRLNCNIIRGQIDSKRECLRYIQWAKECGIDRIRFAELKIDKVRFVSLCRIWRGRYGLSENPYINGCNQNAVIEGVSVNFRQMCGLQTDSRARPENPKNVNEKLVLYYDGLYYTGWQSQRR